MKRSAPPPISALLWASALACALVLLAAPAAWARKPVISYVDAQEAFQLYDAETGQNVSPAPPVPVPKEFAFFRWGTSANGRYIVFNDAEKKLHLLDRTTEKQVPLPGIDAAENPGNLTVSDTGLIAFDANGEKPTYLYDSGKGDFVDAGLGDADPAKPENRLRQPQLSGSGQLLVGTCFDDPMTLCATAEDSDSDVFMQDLAAAQRLSTPDEAAGESVDEEHPCINGDGSLYGVETPIPPEFKKDVLLFARSGSEYKAIEAPGLNDPAADDRYCRLSPDGSYVSLIREDGETAKYMLYERASKSFVALPELPFDYRSTLSDPLVLAEPINGPGGKQPKRRKHGKGRKHAACGGKKATIVGTGKRDRLRGTKKRDVIAGLGGNDVIRGLSGSDIACGGAGRDRLLGGGGSDVLLGGRGRDVLLGGPGRDMLRGGPGKDRLLGGPGADRQKQ